MATTYDVRDLVGRNRAQSPRTVRWRKRFSFAQRSLAAGESAAFLTLPKGFVCERVDAVLRTAQGAAGTFQLGVDGNLTAFATGLNANGTPNAQIVGSTTAVVTTSANAGGTYTAAEQTLINELKGDLNQLAADVNKPGFYCHTDTVAAISVASGQPTLNAAVVDVIFIGYMIPTT